MAGEKVGNISKAAVAGLTVVKAHPVVFGVVVAVAVGVVIYQIVKSKKERVLTHSSGRTTRHCENMYYYDPETKSVTDSAVPASNSVDNNLRKRQVMRSASSSPDKKCVKSPDNKKNNLSDSKNVQSESIGNNQNIDHNKVLPDKNLDTAMSVEEKINDYFLRNISETESIASGSSKKSTEFSSDSSVPCCNCEAHSDENSDTVSDPDSSSSDNISEKSNEKFKRAYVEEMCKALNEDINKMNERETSRAPSVCSVTTIESESSLGTLLSGDSELCKGCEQNRVNTYTQPCNHRYMCSDCAMRIFRLFKRCKVCRTRIERIVVEE